MPKKCAVLVIDPIRSVMDVLELVEDVIAEWEPDPTRGLEILLTGRHDVAIVPVDLGDGRGADLIRDALERGCRTPVIQATANLDEAACQAAIDAGARTCVDLSSLGWALRFVHTEHIAGQARQERLLCELASFLNHESKNAVAAIGGAVQVISDRLGPGSAERLICAEIRDRLGVFDTTIDTLSFLLRPHRELVRSRVNARELISSVAVETLGCGIEITGDDVELLGDRALLRRLFEALLRNVSKAANGNGAIRVSILREGEECVLEVDDSRPGVAPRELNLGFDQLYATVEGRPGLGLAVAKRIAETHGGGLGLRCVLGGGLRVSTRLPVDSGAHSGG